MMKDVRVSGWFLQHLLKLFSDIDAITYLKPPDFTNRQILTLGCGHTRDLTLVKGFNRGKKDVKKLYYSKTH